MSHWSIWGRSATNRNDTFVPVHGFTTSEPCMYNVLSWDSPSSIASDWLEQSQKTLYLANLHGFINGMIIHSNNTTTNMKNQYEISWQLPAHPPPQQRRNYNEQAKMISFQIAHAGSASLGNDVYILYVSAIHTVWRPLLRPKPLS